MQARQGKARQGKARQGKAVTTLAFGLLMACLPRVLAACAPRCECTHGLRSMPAACYVGDTLDDALLMLLNNALALFLLLMGTWHRQTH